MASQGSALALAVAEGARLTDRDHRVIGLLADHRLMTADQLARVVFPNGQRARCRLLLLAERGVLARFRPYRRPGSRPWHYTLGLLGAAIRAAATDAPMPRPSDVTRAVLRLQQSTTLGHRWGVVEFFTLLHAAARRTQGAELTEWWPEPVTARACGDIVRPDGYGEWTERTPGGRHRVGFFLEHDTGTEQLSTLLGKIDKYAQLATAGIARPVLFALPNRTRETGLQRAIGEHYGPHGPTGVVVATTNPDQLTGEHPNPAGSIWWLAGIAGHRHRLTTLHPGPLRPLGGR